jgi:CRISPR type III-associated protein (TIGR04423 family)
MNMDNIKSYHNLSEITNLKYEGYVWLSDKTKPLILPEEVFDFSSIQNNPFVVEALLWNEDAGKSIHIMHSGKYQIIEYNLKGLKAETRDEFIEKSYLTHRLGNVKKRMLFKQFWKSEQDPNCVDMEVLKMKALIFIGFEKS